MTTLTHILGVAFALFTLVFVVEKLRRRQLRERHAAWWLIAGAGATAVAAFPGILRGLARLVGIELPVNLIFFLALLVLFLVCIQQSTELTEVEAKTRRLAEDVALLNMQVESLQGRVRSRPAQREQMDAESGERTDEHRGDDADLQRRPRDE